MALDDTTISAEANEQAADPLPAPPETRYAFRGDASYRSGPVGQPLGSEEALAAEIQDPAEHVLHKRPGQASRYSSWTASLRAAQHFTGGDSNRLFKVELRALRDLEEAGTIKIMSPSDVWTCLKQSGDRKLGRLASATRDAMLRNAEILIEGQVPPGLLKRVT